MNENVYKKFNKLRTSCKVYKTQQQLNNFSSRTSITISIEAGCSIDVYIFFREIYIAIFFLILTYEHTNTSTRGDR